MSGPGDRPPKEPADPSGVSDRYWAERGGKPGPRPRHPLTPSEEHAYLVKGSRLCNRWEFYDGHDEWEEVWRRAAGERRHLLHGIIQVAVGYEHCKRGNPKGMRSLLRQGARKLEPHQARPGVTELRNRALADADRAHAELRRAEGSGRDPVLAIEDVDPPKLMLYLDGYFPQSPRDAIRIAIPPS